MKVLVTGIFGFVGQHLGNRLLEQDDTVAGFALKEDIQKKVFPRRVKIFPGDLCDEASISSALKAFRPDVIYHLAALSSVKLSFENPWRTFQANVMGTLNLLEAASRLTPNCRILLVSSSELYGQLDPANMPVKEDAPLLPINPYGVSKATVDLMGYQYYKAFGLAVYRARAFSHAGPRQGTQAVLSDWACQVAKIELGIDAPEIKVGNLQVTRDYTDVRDVVEAYLAIVEKGKPGEAYNVCSGQGRNLSDLLNTIISFSKKRIRITNDPSRMRPTDIPMLIGSPEKLKSHTGWQPKYDIEQTVRDLYEYWLHRLAPDSK